METTEALIAFCTDTVMKYRLESGQGAGLRTLNLTGLWSVPRNPLGRPVTRGAPHRLILGSANYCLASSLITWMIGQNAPSANMKMIGNWEERLIHQTDVLPFRGTSRGWRNKLTRTL